LGAPNNLEQYAQESGRAGPDLLPPKVILLNGGQGRFVEEDVKQYAANISFCR
jgi:superfamily II DNA helicase RecQ